MYSIVGVEKKTVKLIKWYKILVHNMDIVKTGILDKLFAKEVICHEDNEKIKSENLTSQEKNRLLLGKIVRKDISAAYFIFLDVLKEDVFYKEYAAKIEDTEVLQVDLELLCSGKCSNNNALTRKTTHFYISSTLLHNWINI